jgi:protocatechuate 3,4-dioxygenase beta subunit
MTDNDAYVRAVHDRGLAFDLGTLSRRRALGLHGAAGVAGLIGCTPATNPSAPITPAGDCVAEVPGETAGPFPGDGSNGANALTTSGVVRNDLRSSFGGPTGVAAGVPLTLRLTVLNLADACQPFVGAAVYVWHCDREGNYSMYSSAVRDENYLRGVAATDATGSVEFTSIIPGCYSGRWPHIHFEVFESIDAATSGQRQIVKTSQIALPEDASAAVYATDGYSRSITNLSRVSLGSDSIFREDNGARQMATMTGSNADGWTAALTVAVG